MIHVHLRIVTVSQGLFFDRLPGFPLDISLSSQVSSSEALLNINSSLTVRFVSAMNLRFAAPHRRPSLRFPVVAFQLQHTNFTFCDVKMNSAPMYCEEPESYIGAASRWVGPDLIIYLS